MDGVAGFQLSLRSSLQPAPLPKDGVQFSVIAKGPVLHDWWHYSYTHDSIERPTTMAGEGLTLVDNISYNAAGAMTAFRRRESASITVDNTYAFNSLYQLANQTVVQGSTTLQNLTYTFSATQNNGQILSQTDALSGETVEYEYDSLNRLISAETAGAGGWGLSYSYDGFGNRTNQSVTKGSGPTHSVTINAANNRISTSGYVYDSNGNMTQMPSLTMTYDISNRMVTSNHASAGNHNYGYNQANQRVFERKGTAVTYYLYGLSGERLMAMTETCSASCISYTENERWIYFAGKKMFTKTPTTLKAVTPTRLASEAKHYPYGEVQGAAPTDTKDYFATYRRDETGLDYAMNRHYSPAMGRFTTPDPYGGSANVRDPQSWNRYAYVSNNPISFVDPTGEFISVLSGEPKIYVVFVPLYDRIEMRCLLNPALCGEHSGKMDVTGSVALRSELGGPGTRRPNSDRGIAGVKTALDAIGEKCADALGAPSVEAAKARLESIEIDERPLTLSQKDVGDGGVKTEYIAEIVAEGKIFLNSRIGDSSKYEIAEGVQGLGIFLEERLGLKSGVVDDNHFWAIYILHTLGCVYNALPKDMNDRGEALEEQNWENSQTVVDNCFKNLKKD